MGASGAAFGCKSNWDAPGSTPPSERRVRSIAGRWASSPKRRPFFHSSGRWIRPVCATSTGWRPRPGEEVRRRRQARGSHVGRTETERAKQVRPKVLALPVEVMAHAEVGPGPSNAHKRLSDGASARRCSSPPLQATPIRALRQGCSERFGPA